MSDRKYRVEIHDPDNPRAYLVTSPHGELETVCQVLRVHEEDLDVRIPMTITPIRRRKKRRSKLGGPAQEQSKR